MYMHSTLRSKFHQPNIIDERREGLLPTGTSEHGERGARKFKGIFLARSSFAASVENFEDAMHIP